MAKSTIKIKVDLTQLEELGDRLIGAGLALMGGSYPEPEPDGNTGPEFGATSPINECAAPDSCEPSGDDDICFVCQLEELADDLLSDTDEYVQYLGRKIRDIIGDTH